MMAFLARSRLIDEPPVKAVPPLREIIFISLVVQNFNSSDNALWFWAVITARKFVPGCLPRQIEFSRVLVASSV